MDRSNFEKYQNYHCKFTLMDDSIAYGVAFPFVFPGEPQDAIYFVKSPDLIEFSAAQTVGDLERCRALATPFSIENITEATRLNY